MWLDVSGSTHSVDHRRHRYRFRFSDLVWRSIVSSDLLDAADVIGLSLPAQSDAAASFFSHHSLFQNWFFVIRIDVARPLLSGVSILV